MHSRSNVSFCLRPVEPWRRNVVHTFNVLLRSTKPVRCVASIHMFTLWRWLSVFCVFLAREKEKQTFSSSIPIELRNCVFSFLSFLLFAPNFKNKFLLFGWETKHRTNDVKLTTDNRNNNKTMHMLVAAMFSFISKERRNERKTWTFCAKKRVLWKFHIICLLFLRFFFIFRFCTHSIAFYQTRSPAHGEDVWVNTVYTIYVWTWYSNVRVLQCEFKNRLFLSGNRWMESNEKIRPITSFSRSERTKVSLW